MGNDTSGRRDGQPAENQYIPLNGVQSSKVNPIRSEHLRQNNWYLLVMCLILKYIFSRLVSLGEYYYLITKNTSNHEKLKLDENGTWLLMPQPQLYVWWQFVSSFVCFALLCPVCPLCAIRGPREGPEAASNLLSVAWGVGTQAISLETQMTHTLLTLCVLRRSSRLKTEVAVRVF